MRDAPRATCGFADKVCLLGGLAVIAASVPLVIWAVEALFRVIG